MTFQGEGVLVSPRRSEVSTRRGIGVHLQKFEGRIGYPVSSADVMGCGEKRPGLHGSIGSAGVDRSDFTGGQTPIPGHPRADRYEGGMGGIAGGEFFPIAHHDLHRTLGHLRQQVGDGKVASVSLSAEVSPHRDDVHSDILVLQAHRLSQLQSRPEWGFAGTPGLDSAVIVDVYDAGEGLKVALVTAGDGKGVFQDDIGLAEPLGQIAFFPGEAGLAVVHVRCENVKRRAVVGRDIVMDEGSIRFHGLHGVEDRRQQLVVDLNQ